MDPLHFATYRLQGIVAIYFLKDVLKGNLKKVIFNKKGNTSNNRQKDS